MLIIELFKSLIENIKFEVGYWRFILKDEYRDFRFTPKELQHMNERWCRKDGARLE